MSKYLDPTTARTYWYIRACIKQHGFAPTHREICTALGISSTSTVSAHIARLVAAGKLTKTSRSARAIALPQKVKPPTLDDLASEWNVPGNVLRWNLDADGQYVGFTVIAAGVGVVTTVAAHE